ncbi:glycosyltransferase family 4 protein [soil metagenome]
MRKLFLDHEPADLQHIALIGNSMPRRCGLATFTTHCREAFADAFPNIRIDHYAMDDGAPGIVYPDDVRLIAQRDPAAYSEAARQIEESGAEAIWLQHEYGIFGGSAGEMILGLLERTRLPLVTTLHTLLENPSAEERRVLDAVIARSSRVMVMAELGRQILLRTYGVPAEKIALIHHGVPNRALVDPNSLKGMFGWEGRPVILTFGLLAPGKGIDTVIRAMPAVIRQHPDALYVVLGATHPNLVREQGESLREELAELARSLGVADNVLFLNRFVEQEELLDYLQATDIYVTPYLNPAQITSGTLSYAVGMGKAIVSTPYVQAEEILGKDVGTLVPFGDAEAMGEAIGALLADQSALDAFSARAYALGRQMIWSELARNVRDLVMEARAAEPARLVPRRNYAALAPDASAVFRMSDSTGMLQHGILSIPDRAHGYCIDDNARALMLVSQLPNCDTETRDRWTSIYAAFIQHAWNEDRGRFRNFMAFDRRWCEEEGSEDSNGRTIWALGVTARDAPQELYREWAVHMFDRTASRLSVLDSPRTQAFLILGACAMQVAQPGHKGAAAILSRCGPALLARHERSRSAPWEWFEAVLAYDNARLPQALLLAGHHLGDQRMMDAGFTTLSWIARVQRAPEGHFRAVGTESFGRRYSHPLPFDQQPLEAQATVDAAETAWEISKDSRWLDVADNAYRWFLGQNDLSLPLATPGDGGCFDGLTPTAVNRNQGAESILALQLASCAMKRLSEGRSGMPKGTPAGIGQVSA